MKWLQFQPSLKPVYQWEDTKLHDVELLARREKKAFLSYRGREEVPRQREQPVQRPWGEKEHCVLKESLAGNDLGWP